MYKKYAFYHKLPWLEFSSQYTLFTFIKSVHCFLLAGSFGNECKENPSAFVFPQLAATQRSPLPLLLPPLSPLGIIERWQITRSIYKKNLVELSHVLSNVNRKLVEKSVQNMTYHHGEFRKRTIDKISEGEITLINLPVPISQ